MKTLAKALSLRPGSPYHVRNPRYLTGLDATGGACGLIGCNAKNLTRIRCRTRRGGAWPSSARFESIEYHLCGLGHCFSGQLNSGPHAQCSRLLTHYIVLGSCWARRLQLETVNLESVVIVGPARLYECRPLVCTHRPSHCPSPLVSEVVTRCPNWKVRMDTVFACSARPFASLTPTTGVAEAMRLCISWFEPESLKSV